MALIKSTRLLFQHRVITFPLTNKCNALKMTPTSLHTQNVSPVTAVTCAAYLVDNLNQWSGDTSGIGRKDIG